MDFEDFVKQVAPPKKPVIKKEEPKVDYSWLNEKPEEIKPSVKIKTNYKGCEWLQYVLEHPEYL